MDVKVFCKINLSKGGKYKEEEKIIGMKSFTCEICSKSFNRKGNLKRHMSEVHHEKQRKRYMSDVYHGKQRVVKNNEEKNVREKSFTCEICSKSYHLHVKSAQNLIIYM